MKRILFRFLAAAAVTLVTAALAAPMHAQQQADQDPSTATPHRSEAAQPQQNEAQMPASGETTAQEAKTFSGVIVKESGGFVLKDPVTKVSYKLDDPSKAKQYLSKQVKVSGKLDMSSNTIQVSSIEPIS